jgi:PAS domain S-box-containing protein
MLVVANPHGVRHDGRRRLRYSWLRPAGWARLLLPALIAGLGATGYFVTSGAIQRDRDTAAVRRAEVVSVRTQALLRRARAYVVGLGNALAGEPSPSQRRFAQLETSTVGSVGLVDALWVERVPAARRAAYERGLGVPIVRLTRSGRFERAPAAASYLAATFTSGTRPELRRGVDVSHWPALAAAIGDPASVFAVAASRVGSLGSESGFYLLETSRFGGRGFVAVFVPQGWLTVGLEGDPRRVAISVDGRRLEGELTSPPAAAATFDTLARRWRIEVGAEPSSALLSALPWLALAWPAAAALVVLLVGRGIMRRRQAEREAERIFDLSLDFLCIGGLDGYFKRVNPSFERTLGYTAHELTSRPFADFVHPDDRERTRAALDVLARGRELVQFENRYVCRDGSERWLQWSVRPVPDRGLVYGAARDVTDRRRLADEQAALRRVATLVARGVSPTAVFEAVAAEMAQLLGAESTQLLRYDPDGAAQLVAAHGPRREPPELATSVWQTGRAAHVDRPVGAVGAPIVVNGSLWGLAIVAWSPRAAVLPGAEGRMAQFTELVATAVANADSRAELTASRARVVAAADETRRRIERDLHDGTQQRLVSLALALRATEARVPAGLDELRAELSDAAQGLAGAVEDLQEFARGIHPVVLSKGGLAPALKTLARRSSVPVELRVHAPRRLATGVEAAAYYVVSEALTNAAKHARASVVYVDLEAGDSVVNVTIRDDGLGGADPGNGSGLTGLRDRVEALGGTLEIASASGRGTRLDARIPIRPEKD